ncbi:MAG: ribosomal protein methyltransferase [bacterium]|jgi:ribosomal protein L11 methyltransferase
MRRIDLRVRADDLDVAYDRLLPHVRGGLHPLRDGEQVLLVALGERAELAPLSKLAALAGDVLVGEAVERDAGADLETALAALTQTFEIGARVVLRTPAHPAPAAGLVDVVLGREIGFGTGAHPTTRHCIELLLDIEPGGAFADLGCGAGALTIAAAKLGFTDVVGIDVLDRVCETAWRNGEANGVDADFVTGDLLALDRLDVEVAAVNVSELDVHLRVAACDKPELRWLIVSGLDHPEQLAHAVAAYEQAGLVEHRRIDREGWPAVLFAAPPA